MTRRGLINFGALAAILVAAAWIFAIRHRSSDSPPLTLTQDAAAAADDDAARVRHLDASSGSLVVGVDSDECFKLRQKHRELWEQSTACSEETDCLVEKREPLAAGLVDCYRFRNRTASHAEADRIATEWQSRGCTDALTMAIPDECPPLPAVHCHKGRCIERPQQPVPIDWKRFWIDHAFRIYLPPDFQHTSGTNALRGTRLSFFTGEGRSLEIDLTRRAPVTKANVADGEMTLFVSEQPFLIDGHPSILFKTIDRFESPNTREKGTWSIAELVDVGAPGLGYLSTVAGTSSNLHMVLSCNNAERCEPARLIFEQMDVLLTINQPRDASADAHPR